MLVEKESNTLIPDPYDLRNLLNNESQIEKISNGSHDWKVLTEVGIDLRKKGHKEVFGHGEIFIYEAFLGWRHSPRMGDYPVIKRVIHQGQVPLFFRLVSEATKRSIVKIPKRKYRKRKSKAQSRTTGSAIDLLSLFSCHRRKLAETELPFDRVTGILIKNLQDFDGSDPTKLNDAYLAIDYALQDEDSVMNKWVSQFGKSKSKSSKDQWMSFNQCLDYTMGVYR